MADEVLFTVTKEHLNTGLRGFPVGTVRTSAFQDSRLFAG